VPSFYEINNDIYEFKIHWNPYISYDFKIDTNWNIEPSVVVRAVAGAPINYDINAFVRYKEKIWFGPTYRSNSIAALSIGGLVAKNLVFLYTYDFSLPFNDYKGVLADNSYGGHEITLGYRFGTRGQKPKTEPARAAQVDSLSKAADDLNKKVQALADSLAKLKTYPDPNPAIQDLEKQVKELNALLLAQGADKDIQRIAKTVYFVTDSDQLTDYSKNKLNELVDILKKYPTFRLTIEGHTDNTASEAYNQDLSERRAKSVASYLISKGIDSARFTTAGYGELRPIDTNNTKEGRQNNRRTEIKAY
jgi:outer membrane protein OmpA-like peptidoglycan-associated protein